MHCNDCIEGISSLNQRNSPFEASKFSCIEATPEKRDVFYSFNCNVIFRQMNIRLL
jgi:hypothetical protein